MKKNGLLNAYSTVSQLAFVVATPLLVFIWGGSWLIKRFGLPEQMRAVFIILGVVAMIASLVSYFCYLAKTFGNTEKDKRYPYARRETDYYDDK